MPERFSKKPGPRRIGPEEMEDLRRQAEREALARVISVARYDTDHRDCFEGVPEGSEREIKVIKQRLEESYHLQRLFEQHKEDALRRLVQRATGSKE